MLLKDCCDFQEGYVNPSQDVPEYFGGSIKWLRASDLTGGFVYDTERKLTEAGYKSAGKSASMFPTGSLAISKSGTIGVLGILKAQMCGNRAVINIRVNSDKADLHYVFYTLKNGRDVLLGKTGGSIQKNLYVSALETLPLVHGKLERQKEIGAVLSTLDAKVDLNNRINAELEALAKTIYDYWFVQFDFPDDNGRPYKTSGGKMEYNPILKREIPEGWEVGALDDLGEIVGGSTPSTTNPDNFGQNMIPWITPKDLSDNRGKKFISRGATDVSEAGRRSASLKLYAEGTVLMSSRAPVGYLAIALNPVTTNQGFKSFVLSKGYGTTFVYYTVARSMPAIIQQASGSTFVEISGGVLKAIHAVLPPQGTVKAFCAALESIIQRQKVAELENRELTQLRDWLLPLLMNGQVQVM